MYDIVIIGAGPAGMTAALYALRSGKSVLLLEKESMGGQMAASALVENLPMCENMSGLDLADRMLSKIIDMGAEIELDEATGIEKAPFGFTVHGNDADYEGKAVIIASGVRHRELGIPGEAELAGSGVSYCAVCDGAFFKGQPVAVVGGGKTAVQSALTLSALCSKVYVLYRRSAFTKAEKVSVDALTAKENVKILFDTVVTRANGEEKLESLDIETAGEKSVLPVSALFVAAGLVPSYSAFAEAGLDKDGYFDADESCLTGIPGVFAAGDCRRKEVRQIATAVSDGAVAALAACAYIDKQ